MADVQAEIKKGQPALPLGQKFSIYEEKPYTAERTLQSDDERRKVVTELLRGLVDHAADLPQALLSGRRLATLKQRSRSRENLD